MRSRYGKRTVSFIMILSLVLSVSPFTALAAQVTVNGQEEDNDIPKTGLEIRKDGSWTTYQEELDFLEELSEKSDRMEYSVYGESGEGRPLHLVKVGYPRPGTDEEIASGRNILIVGTFHGNEPSGREMALKLMRDLAFTDDPDLLELMEKSTILFVPTMNPDGREANKRRNKDNFDLNRDALMLKTPEHQTLAKIQKTFKPDIILDAHERMSGPNISLLGNLNLNVDKDLQQVNERLIDDYMFPDLEEAGFTVTHYPPGALPINTRNMSGLRHSIGVLSEASWDDEPLVRVAAQMEAAYSLLRFYQEEFDLVGEIVSKAPENKKRDGENRSKPFYLDGWVGNLPDDESAILDPPPCGYLMNEVQRERIERQIELFEIQLQEVNNGYFVTMAQPMMTVIPFILDPRSEIKLVNGVAVNDCSELESLEPPNIPEPSQYQTDFTHYDAGEKPSDWTELWGDSHWTIQDNPKRLEHVVTDGADRRFLAWDKVGEVHGDVEVAALVRANNEGELFQVHLHGSGRVGTENGYYLDVTKKHGKTSIRISRLLRGTNTVLATEELDFDLDVDTWYQVVFGRQGNALNGKVWPYGEAEPEDWQITFDDDMYIDFGKVGVGHDSTGMVNDWKYFSVGTYGEHAGRAPDDLIEGVDKSVLQRRVQEIGDKHLNEENYSPESWEDLQQALNEAKIVLDNDQATQVQVDLAVKALYNAYSALSAHYQTDFSEYTVGEAPSDWSTLWRKSGWTVKANPSRLEHFVTEGGGRRVLTWDKAGDIVGDVELSALVKANPGATMFQIHLQASGDAGNENSYYLDLRSSGNVRINRNMNGAFNVLKSSPIPFTPQGDNWYQVVFKREGVALKGKVWPYGEAEPSDWQVEVEDNNFVKGKVGVGHVSSGVTNEWAFFGVGTHDEEAPRPPENLIVDKSPLEDKIAEIESHNLNGKDFTDDSWGNLQSALNEAKELLDKPDITQADIVEEIQKLDEVVASLQTVSKQFNTDFSGYEAGNAPADWSTLWRESGWTVKDSPSRLEHFVTEGGGRRVLTWDKAGTIYGDVEVTGVVRAKDYQSTMFQLHLQASGSAGSENSYYLDLRNGKVRINRNMNSYFDILKSADFPYTVEPNAWLQVALKKEGSTLKGKVWPFGEEEPSDWQVEVEDDNLFKGQVGVGHVTSGATNDWAYFGVGTNDQRAPRAPEDLFDLKPSSVAQMKSLVERFAAEGEITNRQVARLLQTHLTAVGHYEDEGSMDKAIKHMNSFKQLLHYEQDNGFISKKASSTLTNHANNLMKQWK